MAKTKKRLIHQLGLWLVIFFFLNWPIVDALTISNVQSSNLTENSAIITWQTNETADSSVSYGINQSNLTLVTSSTLVNNHSLTLTSLLNSTLYYFKIKSGTTEDNNSNSFYQLTTLAAKLIVNQSTSIPILNNTLNSSLPVISVNLSNYVSTDKIDITGNATLGTVISLTVNSQLISTKTVTGNYFAFADVRLTTGSLNRIILSAKNPAGQIVSQTFNVYCDSTKLKLSLNSVPTLLNDTKLNLTGGVNKNASIEIWQNNLSIYKIQTFNFSHEITLKDGENNLTLTATDLGGLSDSVSFKVQSDTKEPVIKKATLVSGNSYYQGRAKTDITGETKPGAKVYLYVFKQQVYANTPDFNKAYAVTTADKDGIFKFSAVDIEHPPLQLNDLKPKQIPASLKDVVLPAIDVVRGQQQNTYELYLIAEDSMNRVSTLPWKQQVLLYTCYSADYAFHVNPLVEFQLPYRLDPDMLDSGRQVITAIVNMSYMGSGVSGDGESGFRIIGTPRLERACTSGMVKETDYAVSCSIMPSVFSTKTNYDSTALFIQTTLAQSKDLTKKTTNYWDEFKNRQLKFPLKLTISFQERSSDGKWGDTKTQVSCLDLGYFVDIPIESKEMIPDFLADEGVTALNETINAIELILPYIKDAMLVTGIGCGVSILAKMATRWYRLFISKLEPYLGKLNKDDDKKCEDPDKLFLASTIEGWNKLSDKSSLPSDYQNRKLDDKCPMTANAWKAEDTLQTALRWTCDRFFCHQAPAKWTEDKKEDEVMAAQAKEQSCSSQTSQGVALQEIKSCPAHYKDHPEEFSPTLSTDKSFKTFLENGNGVCYIDSKQNVYFYDSGSDKNKDSETTHVYYLEAIGNRLGVSIGTISNKDLVAYKPEGAKTYIVSLDQTCQQICDKRTGYSIDKCYEVDTKTQKLKETLKNNQYEAGYAKDCFPTTTDKTLKTCVCKKTDTPTTVKEQKTELPRVAEPKEEWSYREAQQFRESGGNEKECTGGSLGTCYPSWRYYSGRDLSAAFGANHVLDYATGKNDITEVNPFTQHLGAFQTICLSGIYNRLKMLQSILVGMRNCLVEAKHTGLTDSGQCKEIFSQAVCGLLYKLIAYAAKGCLPLPFLDIGKEADESVWEKGIGFGLGAVQETLDSSMGDLKEEYGNAQLSELFSAGAQGVTKNICLAAFGYDWPYGMDFLMDSAYRTPMKTSALIIPAERELMSYNPVTATTIYNYRVGASVFPGCKIKSYKVKLKCVGPEDIGKENVNCPDAQSCPCLYVTEGKDSDREYDLYTDVKGLSSGSYVSVPISSPATVDQIYRYDHVVLELELDRFEDATKCFDTQYREGSKGVFYAPITDVSGKPLVTCKTDVKTGKFQCSDLSSMFGVMGNTYLESPYVECWNKRANAGAGAWGSCESLNNFIKGEEVKIRPLIQSDGKKQCLFITLTGMSSPIIKSLPENTGPTIRPELSLITVTDELLGLSSSDSLAYSGSSCGTPSYTAESGSVNYNTITFTYSKDTAGNYNLKIDTPQAVTVSSPYAFDTFGYLTKSGSKSLTSTDVADFSFTFSGFKVKKVIDVSGTGGSCTYQAKSSSSNTAYGSDVRQLDLGVELRYPFNGECTSAVQPIKVNFGKGSHRTTIKIQKKVIYDSANTVNTLHDYWKKKDYKNLLDQTALIIVKKYDDLGDATAYYYAAAASIMLGSQSTGTEQTTYYANAVSYVTLFNQRTYSSDVSKTSEYLKIQAYMTEISNKYGSGISTSGSPTIPSSSSLCGSSTGLNTAFTVPSNWASYKCADPTGKTGCYAYTTYLPSGSDWKIYGCPGSQQCCPP